MPTPNPSWLIPLALALPNLLWLVWPPVDAPAPVATRGLVRVAEILERIGQVGCLAIPLFCRWESPVPAIWPVLMTVAIASYYAGWLRYFARGRRFALLFAPLAGVPIPLAISPVAFLLASAGALRSPALLVAAVVLATGHLPVSWMTARSAARASRSGA